MNLKNLKDYLLSQASQPSTWRGVVLVSTAIGATLSPDQQEAIVTIGLGLAGVIGAVTSDKKGSHDAN